jgi:hypothetical protein
MDTVKKFYKSISGSVKSFAMVLGCIAGIIILLMVKFALILLAFKGAVALFTYAVAVLTSVSFISLAMVVIAAVIVVELIKQLVAISKRIFAKKLVIEITDGELTT